MTHLAKTIGKIVVSATLPVLAVVLVMPVVVLGTYIAASVAAFLAVASVGISVVGAVLLAVFHGTKYCHAKLWGL